MVRRNGFACTVHSGTNLCFVFVSLQQALRAEPQEDTGHGPLPDAYHMRQRRALNSHELSAFHGTQLFNSASEHTMKHYQILLSIL